MPGTTIILYPIPPKEENLSSPKKGRKTEKGQKNNDAVF
jgi:hypothetical protein